MYVCVSPGAGRAAQHHAPCGDRSAEKSTAIAETRVSPPTAGVSAPRPAAAALNAHCSTESGAARRERRTRPQQTRGRGVSTPTAARRRRASPRHAAATESDAPAFPIAAPRSARLPIADQSWRDPLTRPLSSCSIWSTLRSRRTISAESAVACARRVSGAAARRCCAATHCRLPRGLHDFLLRLGREAAQRGPLARLLAGLRHGARAKQHENWPRPAVRDGRRVPKSRQSHMPRLLGQKRCSTRRRWSPCAAGCVFGEEEATN